MLLIKPISPFVLSFPTFRYSLKNHSTSSLIKALLNMPREIAINQELRKIRLKVKEKAKRYPPGIITAQVLGSGTLGAPRSLYVFTDQSRYLFNCGEGTQRLAHEHKMKLAKLEHIFITRPCWENLGGLPGVALTIQDVGVPEITIHAPEGTTDLFAATRRFVVLKDLVIKSETCSKNSFFEDNAISVKYIPIKSSKTEFSSNSDLQSVKLEDDDVDYYAHERKKDGIVMKTFQLTKIPPICLTFVCKLKSKPGALNLDTCVAKGVPPGPLLGKLKNGEDVTLENGTIVRSCDVTEPEDPGPTFLVVDCPSEDYLTNFVNEVSYENLITDYGENPVAIFHFTPSNIMDNPSYKKWMSQFDTEHIVINELNSCAGSVAVHRLQHKLNLIHPTIFPLLYENSPKCSSQGVVNGNTFMSVQLRPLKGLDFSNLLTLTPDAYRREPLALDGFSEELEKFQVHVKNYEDFSYPKIVFLGTGSCIPNKTRNTSAIVIELSESENVLLDCGEGTFGQILRFYGNRANGILKNLKMIYVSHLHADHHIGLVGVLKGRRKVLGQQCEPLYLAAPRQIMFWLNFYHQRFENILEEFTLVPNDLMLTNTRADSTLFQTVTNNLNLTDLSTVFVQHCPNSFGVALIHKTGWKLTYSGDTMPCQNLVALGLDSDILIHEATMEDELEAEARMKFHSTTTQAIDVGRAMNAKFILLTHFSQRYAKLPRLQENLVDNVGIAFDNMQITLKQLPLLPKMHRVLKAMFSEDVEELEIKAAKRKLRTEKKRAASQSPIRMTKLSH